MIIIHIFLVGFSSATAIFMYVQQNYGYALLDIMLAWLNILFILKAKDARLKR